LYSDGANPTIFHTNATQRMRITPTGDVAIGTATATERLTVSGSIDATDIRQSVLVKETGTAAANSLGFRGLPVNAQGAGYTLVLADQGKMVTITGGVTIPANGSVAFPVGTTLTIYNNSASNQTISITTDTLRLAGTATTGARTVAQRGFATLVKVAATEWVATGNVT
jgi:hypothetical protein